MSSLIRILVLVVLFSATGFATLCDTLENQQRTVVVVPVSGDVDPGMAAFIARALEDASQYPDPLIVLQMDTFGGRVDAALQIVDSMLTVPESSSVAFVQSKAISAGALIALSCGTLIMKSNTTIGDCAPIAFSGEGPEMLGEKFQSPLRAKFRALARRNGYPATLAESMVTADMVVYQVTFSDTVMYLDSLALADLSEQQRRRIVSRKTVVSRGELLTMDAVEARDLGFASYVTDSFQGMLERLNLTGAEVVRIEPNWSERFVRFIATIAPVLLMIGFAALYAEIRSPGFGVFGIIGIICLGLVFGGQYIVGLAAYTELLLLIIGVLLLAMELFVIPGFGIAGIAGIAFMAAGMILSFQDFVIPQPEFPWQAQLLERNLLMVLLSLFGSTILLFLFFRYLFPRLGTVVPGPYLSHSLAQTRHDSEEPSAVKPGETGVVVSPLRPSGKVRIGDDVYDVIADGEFLDKGTAIVVTAVRGSRIVVARSTGDADAH